MRTLTEKYLGGVAIEEERFKIDLAVLDRYQSFSSELLRLALLGITGYGFLIVNVAFKFTTDNQAAFYKNWIVQTSPFLTAGAVLLGIACASALGHRYFSTDCLTHFVRRIRLTQSLVADAPIVDTAMIIENEEASLDKDLRLCKWMLIVAVLSLASGVGLVATAFVLTLNVSGAK